MVRSVAAMPVTTRSPAPYAELGLMIQRARQRLGMTQQAMADKLGVDRATVGVWETGRQYPAKHAGAVEQLLSITIPPRRSAA